MMQLSTAHGLTGNVGYLKAKVRYLPALHLLYTLGFRFLTWLNLLCRGIIKTSPVSDGCLCFCEVSLKMRYVGICDFYGCIAPR